MERREDKENARLAISRKQASVWPWRIGTLRAESSTVQSLPASRVMRFNFTVVLVALGARFLVVRVLPNP